MAKEKFAESREEIAEILGVEVRTITNYIRRYPDFPNRVDGKRRHFPIARCVAWKINHDVEAAIASMAAPPPKGLEDAEKRKAIADAEIAEIKLLQLRSELTPNSESIQEAMRAYSAVRARLMSVPGEYAPRMMHLDTMASAISQLRDLINTVIGELPHAVAAAFGDLEGGDEELAPADAESGAEVE